MKRVGGWWAFARSVSDRQFVTFSRSPESTLPPAQAGRDVREDWFNHRRVVFDAERVRHGQQQRIGFGDGLVASQFFDQRVWFSCIGPTKNGPPVGDRPD